MDSSLRGGGVGGMGLSTKEKRTFFLYIYIYIFFFAIHLTTKPRGGGLKASGDCPLKMNFFCGFYYVQLRKENKFICFN